MTVVKLLLDRGHFYKYDHGQYLYFSEDDAMQTKRIFILNGHPAQSSLSRSFAETYEKSALDAGHEVRMTHLNDLAFDADFGISGSSKPKPLEQCLQSFQKDIEWSDHFVVMTPMWWGGLPAKLKGIFDRTFLPGWAYDPRQTKMGKPAPLLAGRTARAIVTSDTPTFFLSLFYRKALLHQIKGQIFHFVGMKPAKVTHFAPASKAGPEKITPWLKQVAALGQYAQ